MRSTLPLPRWSLWLIVPGVLVVLWIVAFAVDSAAHSGQVARNVTLAGEEIGGLGEDDLAARIDGLSESYGRRTVVLRAPDGTEFELDAAELGLAVDAEATADRALDAGRGGFLTGPFGWLGSFLSDRSSDVVLAVDDDAVASAVAALTGDEPIEPTLVVLDGELQVRPGFPGQVVDADGLGDALRAAAGEDAETIELPVNWAPVPPQREQADVEAVAAEISGPLGDGVLVRINAPSSADEATDDETTEDEADDEATDDETADDEAIDDGIDGGLDDGIVEIDADTVVSWIEISDDGDEITWSIDDDRAVDALERLVVSAVPGSAEFAFEVDEADQVQIVSAEGGRVCCAPGAGTAIEDALRDGSTDPIALPLRSALPDEARQAAEELGIVELVGEFTTEHACCENRVVNIQRIADIVRGYVIEPGGELSINDFVGRRTREKGFVSAGVIQNGVFESDVGGGISQFATTLFNAAFFAGLDFGEYQSHSIYISRYPYGREATLSFPNPDLEIRNTTPHGVLVWTEYTDTSITVKLFSTTHAVVEETGQSRSSAGACTRVFTGRSRTFPDGTEAEDNVTALYRPAEGLDCNGNPTVPPSTTSSTETTLAPGETAPPTTGVPGTSVPPTTGVPGTTAPPTTPPPTAPPTTPAPTAPPTTPAPTAPPTTPAPPPPPTTAAG
ncbi:MAG: VanW family protein [Actinomycetota bacterium]